MSFSRENISNNYPLKPPLNEDMSTGSQEFSRPNSSNQQRALYRHQSKQQSQQQSHSPTTIPNTSSMLPCSDSLNIKSNNDSYSNIFHASPDTNEQQSVKNPSNAHTNIGSSSPNNNSLKLQHHNTDINRMKCTSLRNPPSPRNTLISNQSQQQQGMSTLIPLKTQLKIGSADEDYIARGPRNPTNNALTYCNDRSGVSSNNMSVPTNQSHYEYCQKMAKQNNQSFSNGSPVLSYFDNYTGHQNAQHQLMPSLKCNPKVGQPSDYNLLRNRSLSHPKNVMNMIDHETSVYDVTGQLAPPNAQPLLSTVFWDDEQTLCFQVEVNGIVVARREDNNMINGTKLLNVSGMSRGKRDGLLKNEKVRHVVKIGAMNLKGVWIPFERALNFANRENITSALYPVFVRDIRNLYSNILLSMRCYNQASNSSSIENEQNELVHQSPYQSIDMSNNQRHMHSQSKQMQYPSASFQSSMPQRILPQPLDAPTPNQQHALNDFDLTRHQRHKSSVSMKSQPRHKLSKSGNRNSWMMDKDDSISEQDVYSGIFDHQGQSQANTDLDPQASKQNIAVQSEQQPQFGHRAQRYNHASKEYSRSQTNDEPMPIYMSRDESVSMLKLEDNDTPSSASLPTQQMHSRSPRKTSNNNELWPSISRNFRFPMNNMSEKIPEQGCLNGSKTWNNDISNEQNIRQYQRNSMPYYGNEIPQNKNAFNERYALPIHGRVRSSVDQKRANSSPKNETWTNFAGGTIELNKQSFQNSPVEQHSEGNMVFDSGIHDEASVRYDRYNSQSLLPDMTISSSSNQQLNRSTTQHENQSGRLSQSIYHYDQSEISSPAFLPSLQWDSVKEHSELKKHKSLQSSGHNQQALNLNVQNHNGSQERYDETNMKLGWSRSKPSHIVSPGQNNPSKLIEAESPSYDAFELQNPQTANLPFKETRSLNYQMNKLTKRSATPMLHHPESHERDMSIQSPRKYRKSISQNSNSEVQDIYWTPIM